MDIMDIRNNSFAPYGEHPDTGTEFATRHNLCQALLTHDTDRVRELLKTGDAIVEQAKQELARPLFTRSDK